MVSGLYTERDLVDLAEVDGHPFMLGSQFHPEFRSRPLAPHPLFRGFVAAAQAHAGHGMALPAPEVRMVEGA